jgi:CDP-diacylglycerol--glycerol-3-phosphate 3-phosphatidyltransferase
MSSNNSENWSNLGRFWTMPNVLSMMRLVLIIPLFWLIVTEGKLFWIMIIVVLAIASDYFDGRIARWSNSVSEWGKVLDPMADKVGGGAVVAALTIQGSLPLWFLVALAVRDFAILLGGGIIRARTGQITQSMWSGKVAVTAVAITALAALLRADAPVLEFCIWASTVLLAYSFLRYMVRFFSILGAPSDAQDPERPEVGSEEPSAEV